MMTRPPDRCCERLSAALAASLLPFACLGLSGSEAVAQNLAAAPVAAAAVPGAGFAGAGLGVAGLSSALGQGNVASVPSLSLSLGLPASLPSVAPALRSELPSASLAQAVQSGLSARQAPAAAPALAPAQAAPTALQSPAGLPASLLPRAEPVLSAPAQAAAPAGPARRAGGTGATREDAGEGSGGRRSLQKISKAGRAVAELSKKPELAGAAFDGSAAKEGASEPEASPSPDLGRMEDALDFIRKYDSFVVVAHESPDGDAVGSVLGMVGLLRAMGKTAHPYLPGRVPPSFRFLPGSRDILSDPDKLPQVQAVISVDVSETARMGSRIAPFVRGKPLLMVDHHEGRAVFGDARWVEPETAAAAEMVARLWGRLGLKPDKDSATAMYTGIFTDSGLFRYHVTAETMRTAAALIEAGADPSLISRKVEQSRPAGYFELLKVFTETLQTDPKMRRGDATFSLDAFARAGSRESVTFFADNILQVESMEVSIIFLQVDQDTWVASLRSKTDVDVDLIARKFGGGGHKNAAACKVRMPLAELQAKVRAAVDEALRAKP